MTGRLARRSVFISCGLGLGVLALAICGVLGWLALSMQPADSLARVRQLPVYPGASSVQTQANLPAAPHPGGTLTFDAPASIEDMFAYYDGALKQAGWQKVVTESDGGSGKYSQPEGSFQGIEFVAGSGGVGSGFPWLRIKRNPAPMWLQVDVSPVYHGTVAWTRVSVELTQP